MLAVVDRLCGGMAQSKQDMLDHAQRCVEPAIDYFNQQLGCSLQRPLAAFKVARFFSPQKIHDIQPTAASVDTLQAFPFFGSREDIEQLKSELPAYIAKSADVDSSIDLLQWWQRNASTLPHWAAAARKVLLVQPSSAASERVFSLLNASFQSQQHNTLQDYLETSIMLQYNSR